MAIPKKIHYCWFGGNPLPGLAVRCMESWRKYLPEYEIVRWDESNYDVHAIPYISEAYKAGKYAFVSDYARFDILYRFGGLYFDIDVELIRRPDDIIRRGNFLGCENQAKRNAPASELCVAAGLGMGAVAGLPFYAKVLEHYKKSRFLNEDGRYNLVSVVTAVTALLVEDGLANTPDIQLVNGIYIYPWQYFCPFNYNSRKLDIMPETVSIHHYNDSWHDDVHKKYMEINRYFRFLPGKTRILIGKFVAAWMLYGFGRACALLGKWFTR